MFNRPLKIHCAYSAVLGRVDCIIFTGGIGENDSDVRKNSCSNLANLGIIIDEAVNNQNDVQKSQKLVQRKALSKSWLFLTMKN